MTNISVQARRCDDSKESSAFCPTRSSGGST